MTPTNQIIISAEEKALLLTFNAACDAQAEGFRRGMEAAKQIYLEHFAKKKHDDQRRIAATPPPAAEVVTNKKQQRTNGKEVSQ